MSEVRFQEPVREPQPQRQICHCTINLFKSQSWRKNTVSSTSSSSGVDLVTDYLLALIMYYYYIMRYITVNFPHIRHLLTTGINIEPTCPPVIRSSVCLRFHRRQQIPLSWFTGNSQTNKDTTLRLGSGITKQMIPGKLTSI